MADVDSLWTELYPEDASKLGIKPKQAPNYSHRFDDDEGAHTSHSVQQKAKACPRDQEAFDDEIVQAETKNAKVEKKSAAQSFDDDVAPSRDAALKVGQATTTPTHTFDEPDDHEGTDHAAERSKPRKPVPFPTFPSNLQALCGAVCTLCSSSQRGGCVYIQCLKCDHRVVMKANAAWDDAAFTSEDMYLAVRYYYPDWGAFNPKMLVPAAAPSMALCCQCSWLTVGAAPVAIRCSGADAFFVEPSVSRGQACPRWVCKGHQHAAAR